MSFLVATSADTRAGDIAPRKSIAFIGNDRIEISARFDINLSPTLELALQNGLSLPFQFEFQLTRPLLRAWVLQFSDWFDPTASLTQRLSYAPLTRQYRVQSGGISRSFSTLTEALSVLGMVSAWQVLPNTSIARDSSAFAGRVRLKMDISQLPKPYQMVALGHADWHLGTAWVDLLVTNTSTEVTQP